MEKCSDQRRLDEMIEFPFFSPDDDAHVGEGREEAVEETEELY